MRVSGRQRDLWSCAALVAFVLFGRARTAAAEPISAREPRLLRETGENTTVIDAFDEGDPFDLDLSLTFSQAFKHAHIRRETALAQPGLSTGGFVANTENVATFRQSRSVLELGADVGLYKDLALSLRLPLVLADSRELGDLAGSTRNPERLQDSRGDTLFSVPFRSPTRSGVDVLGVGLDYAIFNQQRNDAFPTWVVGLEGIFSIGSTLHACNDDAPTKCPDPAAPSGLGRDPGISRGMNTYAIHTVLARRYGYVEPYVGFRGQIEVPQSNSDYGATSDLRGAVLTTPPVISSVMIGTEVFPWENREKFRRLGLDFKLRGSYASKGRDYTELFDALGSSQARSLRDPNPGAYRAGDGGTSVVDPTSAKVYFAGLTDQQAFGSLGASAGITFQAGEYIKLTAGAGFSYVQSHLITGATPCDASFKQDIGASGPCRTPAEGGGAEITGVPNPNHRPAIDLPGHRFVVDDTTILDFWLGGVVMF